MAFLEKKQTELANTGHKLDNETFITHLLTSLSQSEYEGAILVIKEKLRKGDVELPEMSLFWKTNIKHWDEEEDDYALFSSQSNKESPRKHLKDAVDTVENLDIKQLIVPIKKATKIRAQKAKMSTKRNRMLKETTKERDIGILNVLIVGNVDIMHEIVQKHVIMLILLKKVS